MMASRAKTRRLHGFRPSATGRHPPAERPYLPEAPPARDALDEAGIRFQPVLKPVLFRFEADQYAGRPIEDLWSQDDLVSHSGRGGLRDIVGDILRMLAEVTGGRGADSAKCRHLGPKCRHFVFPCRRGLRLSLGSACPRGLWTCGVALTDRCSCVCFPTCLRIEPGSCAWPVRAHS